MEKKSNEPKNKIQWKTKDELRKEIDKTLNLEYFEKEMLRLNNLGADNFKKHKEQYPPPVKDKDGKIIENKGNKPFHPAGTKEDCLLCKIIAENHDRYMLLQEEYLGITGIPFQNMMAAIKITVGTLRLAGILKVEEPTVIKDAIDTQ